MGSRLSSTKHAVCLWAFAFDCFRRFSLFLFKIVRIEILRRLVEFQTQLLKGLLEIAYFSLREFTSKRRLYRILEKLFFETVECPLLQLLLRASTHRVLCKLSV